MQRCGERGQRNEAICGGVKGGYFEVREEQHVFCAHGNDPAEREMMIKERAITVGMMSLSR